VRSRPAALVAAALAGSLALVAVVAGCASAGGSGPAAGAQRVTVTATDAMRFEPASLAVRAGQPAELTLRNDGQIPHDFTLTEGAARPVKVVAAGRQTVTATFTISRLGSYRFICSQPGHAEAGQVGVPVAE
jgi:uncharacterized cupredoxin-like copper-binding protein